MSSTTVNGQPGQQQAPPIDLMLRVVPTHPSSVLTQLEQHPSLANAADANGYTLLHAASSYSQLDLMRALVTRYNVAVNSTDPDGETALFAAETVEAARCLVEELGADTTIENDEGIDAETNARTYEQEGDEGQWGAVAAYLAQLRESRAGPAADGQVGGEELRVPPPLPDNVRITRMAESELNGDDAIPFDPVFRARIEALAAREDFNTEEGQEELRKLVAEAVGGLGGEDEGQDRATRRRLD